MHMHRIIQTNGTINIKYSICHYRKPQCEKSPVRSFSCINENIDLFSNILENPNNTKEIAKNINIPEVKFGILKHLGDKDYRIRFEMKSALVLALQCNKTRDAAIEVILIGLKHPDIEELPDWAKSTVRSNCASILKDSFEIFSEAIPILFKCLDDSSDQVQAMARYALINATKKQPEEILKGIKDQFKEEKLSSNVIRNLVYIIKESGMEEKFLPEIIKLAQGTHKFIVIREFGNTLSKELENRDIETRVIIAKAFAHASRDVVIIDFIPKLVKALFRKELKQYAFEAIKNEVKRDKKTLNLVEKTLNSKEISSIAENLPKLRTEILAMINQLKA